MSFCYFCLIVLNFLDKHFKSDIVERLQIYDVNVSPKSTIYAHFFNDF